MYHKQFAFLFILPVYLVIIIYLFIYKNVIGERAKRARHSQVCSIDIYIYIYIVRANFALITRKEGGA